MQRIFAALIFSALFLVPSAFAAPGAVWTTDSACGGVNINLFDYKTDVYLNGGPSGGGPGLPDGNYWVQVTEPDGTPLGKTPAATAVVSGGRFEHCYQLSAILLTASSGFTMPGYDTTGNNGGEYKVWASMNENFTGGTNKTDNFKVKESVPPPPPGEDGSISGVKWLDTSLDGLKDMGEAPIEGWRIELWRYTAEGTPGSCDDGTWEFIDSALTDSNGFYEFEFFDGLDPLGYYKVVEIFPADSPCGDWEATTSTCRIVDFSLGFDDIVDQDFGNVCYNEGGLTIGYWKTHVNTAKKGPKIDPIYQAAFSIDLCDYGTITNWSQAVAIFNAAEASGDGKPMLAAQLLATELNMLKFADCHFDTALYAGSVEAYEGMTVAAIAAAAHHVLCDPAATKAQVTALIEALDEINNNGHERVLLNSEPCPVEYPQPPAT